MFSTFRYHCFCMFNCFPCCQTDIKRCICVSYLQDHNRWTVTILVKSNQSNKSLLNISHNCHFWICLNLKTLYYVKTSRKYIFIYTQACMHASMPTHAHTWMGVCKRACMHGSVQDFGIHLFKLQNYTLLPLWGHEEDQNFWNFENECQQWVYPPKI